jgi:hypothetical protein
MERWITTGETMEILEWLPDSDNYGGAADEACDRWRDQLRNLGYAIRRPKGESDGRGYCHSRGHAGAAGAADQKRGTGNDRQGHPEGKSSFRVHRRLFLSDVEVPHAGSAIRSRGCGATSFASRGWP